nr:LysR family transcriptional regulator [Pseudomonas sp. Hg5Tf]MDH2559169.1 LysR family transcriptional regulator [Pseudomonas sp. Hg5Tf]
MSRFSRHLPALDTLIAFEAVVRTGSFTRAASELYLTQSAVSKQIKLLEEQLGAVLFERRARGIALTSAGKVSIPLSSQCWRVCWPMSCA